jgi:hypothetical protein
MPFVHWLSKNRLRWWWIRMFVAIGVEPKWQELEGKTGRQKTERYFEYINANTFYRRPSEIRRIFEVQGFKVDFVTTQDPRVQRHPLLGQMARFKLTWGLINWLLVNFVRVELKIEKHTGNSKQ